MEPTNSPVPEPQNKKTFGVLILTGIISLIVGAASGYLIYKNTQNNSSTPTSVSPTVKRNATAPALNASEIVKQISSTMKGVQVAASVDPSTGYANSDVGNLSAYSVPAYQPKGYDFYTMPKDYPGIVYVGDMDTVHSDLNTMRAFLIDHKFTTSSPSLDPDNGVNAMSYFFSPTVECTVTDASYAYKQGERQALLGCADVSSYQQNAMQLKDIATALTANQPSLNQPGLYFAPLQSHQSKTPGYHYATVSIGNIYSPVGGTELLSYQTPDNTWHYFAQTQDEVQCSAYTTKDEQTAFEGTTCFNQPSNTNSTVTIK